MFGRLQLRAEGCLDSALRGKRSPASRGPCPAAASAMAVDDAGAPHAEHAAKDEFRLRHPRLVDRGDRSSAMPDRTPKLCGAADGDATLVCQADDRQVKGFA